MLYAKKEVNGKPFYVKVRDLGDGVKKILSVLLWLDASSPELVLWDDFEASVHPTLIKLVLEWLVKKDWQVVIATHSIDTLLKLLEIDTKNKDSSIILLQKTPEDLLLHKRHTFEELEDFIISNSEELQKKFEPRTTLAILKVIAHYVDASICGPFLLIIDLEHFKTDIAEDVKNQIEREKVSFSIKNIES